MSLNPSWRDPEARRPSRELAFGRTTQRFFLEGEKHEAANWEDVELPPEDTPEPAARSGSFDEIPRRRSATIALVLLVACLVFGSIMAGRYFLTTGRAVDAAKASYAQPRREEALPVPPSTEQARPATVAGAPTASANESSTLASPKGPPPPAPDEETASVAASEPPAKSSPAVASRPQGKKPRALRNYVWSPNAQALVQVEPASAPAPGKVSYAGSETTKGTLLPPAEQPVIERASTGTRPTERPAPAPPSD